MNISPSISIGIPTFNRADLLHRALASVAAQLIPAKEVVVGDNASSDSTKQAVEYWRSRIPNLRYIRRSANIGPLANMLELIRECSGDYFLWLADDDVMRADLLEIAIRELIAMPSLEMLGWSSFTKNYITGEITESSTLPPVYYDNSCYLNSKAYLTNPFSSCYYSLFKKHILESCMLQKWNATNRLFDWMDVAFISSILLNHKAHFTNEKLVVYGIDELKRPIKGSSGETLRAYNPYPWLTNTINIIIKSKTLTSFQKANLIRIFFKSWRNISAHVKANH